MIKIKKKKSLWKEVKKKKNKQRKCSTVPKRGWIRKINKTYNHEYGKYYTIKQNKTNNATSKRTN